MNPELAAKFGAPGYAHQFWRWAHVCRFPMPSTLGQELPGARCLVAALYDPTAALADLHALRRLAAERVGFSLDERGIQHAPPLLGIATSIVAAQERAFRLRQKTVEMQGIAQRIADALVTNVIKVIWE